MGRNVTGRKTVGWAMKAITAFQVLRPAKLSCSHPKHVAPSGLTFCTTKKPINRFNKQSIHRQKLFADYTPDKGLIHRLYRVLNNTGTNNPI